MARVDGDTARVLTLLPNVQPRRIAPCYMTYDYPSRIRWRQRAAEERRLDFRFDVQRLVAANMRRRAREMGIPWGDPGAA